MKNERLPKQKTRRLRHLIAISICNRVRSSNSNQVSCTQRDAVIRIKRINVNNGPQLIQLDGASSVNSQQKHHIACRRRITLYITITIDTKENILAC